LYFSGERGAEFVNPQDITRDNGNYLIASMMEEFLQTFLQNRCERSHLFLAPQSTRISQAPNYRSYLGSEHGPKGGDEINIIKKVLIMDACCDLTVSIMMARPLATKPKARN
jgi:hypothetical protein